MGLVDTYGPAACCDICNEEADESDLEDFGDRMACSTCRAAHKAPNDWSGTQLAGLWQMSIDDSRGDH